MYATKLTFVQDVFGTQRTSEYVCISRPTIFVSDACSFLILVIA